MTVDSRFDGCDACPGGATMPHLPEAAGLFGMFGLAEGDGSVAREVRA